MRTLLRVALLLLVAILPSMAGEAVPDLLECRQLESKPAPEEKIAVYLLSGGSVQRLGVVALTKEAVFANDSLLNVVKKAAKGKAVHYVYIGEPEPGKFEVLSPGSQIEAGPRKHSDSGFTRWIRIKGQKKAEKGILLMVR